VSNAAAARRPRARRSAEPARARPGLLELVRLKVDAIMTVSTPAALAAKNGTTTIPVVFIASDPLGSGLVGSLARPGENLTGLSLALGEEFSRKWLELRVALGAREHRPVSGFCRRGGSDEG